MIKNIIFDLGNVLLNYHPGDFLLRYTDDMNRINTFISKVTRSDTWWQLDRGTISMEKAKNTLLNQYSEEKDLLIPYFDHWMEMLTPIEKNINILGELKQKGYKVYVLSNFITEAFVFVKSRNKFFTLLDGCVISGYEKVIKPEKKIYEILIRKYKLLPEECLFLDDVPGFLIPAKNLGMSTILVRNNMDLRTKLRKFNVNI